MSRKITALARGGTMFAVLALASCQGSESATKAPPAMAPSVASQTVAVQSVKIPATCRSTMQALSTRDQEVWDKLISAPSYRHDSKAHSDFTRAQISPYRNAGCKDKPGADLADCLTDGSQAGQAETVQASHALHDRCFAAFLASY